MRRFLVFQVAALLSVSMHCTAATVEYQYPDLTIVARDEPLQSVLKSLGKEMQIFVMTPTDFNPLVNCDIQAQPIKSALKTLLADFSYSLEWDDKSGRLVGLTILAGGAGGAVATGASNVSRPAVGQGVPAAIASQGSGESVAPPGHDSGAPDHDAAAAEQETQLATERAESEARMAEERAMHEIEMAQRRQEEELAHEERMREEVERHDAEEAAYLESQGLSLPR